MEHSLNAIFATDVVGYRLMGSNEALRSRH